MMEMPTTMYGDDKLSCISFINTSIKNGYIFDNYCTTFTYIKTDGYNRYYMVTYASPILGTDSLCRWVKDPVKPMSLILPSCK